jgi:hypothetical protein
MKLAYIQAGKRMFLRSLRARLHGVKRYKGTADGICRNIIKDCFNGKYFQVSNGHFHEFYTRDFGWCVDSLLKLGYRKKVLKTLSYALDRFSRHNRITTSISTSGKPFDFPFYAPDSLAFLIRSLSRAKAHPLVKKHRDFLNREIMKYYGKVIDKKTGLVRKDMHFSSMKDHSLRISSCYDNVMSAMLAKELDAFKILKNPLKKYNFRKIIMENFWNGRYFVEDLSGSRAVTGDSNVFPFWTGVFESKEMLKKAVSSIQRAGLDRPFPLKYTKASKLGKQKFIALEFFAKNYEGNTVWMHMGPLYVSLVKKIDRKQFKKHCIQYRKLIEKHGNYLELFTPEGNPYKTPFYYSDESMLWAANFLTL